MICYDKNDIKDLKNHEDKYYMTNALFDTMQYKLVRLEVKWAYVACLNVMLKTPLYDYDGFAYIKDDHPQMIEVLKDLAHKNVDQQKIDGYIQELEDCGLAQRKGRNIYLKKISNIF